MLRKNYSVKWNQLFINSSLTVRVGVTSEAGLTTDQPPSELSLCFSFCFLLSANLKRHSVFYTSVILEVMWYKSQYNNNITSTTTRSTTTINNNFLQSFERERNIFANKKFMTLQNSFLYSRQWGVEYIECKEVDHKPPTSVMDMTLNHLMLRF